MKTITFTIHGNQENRDGNPIPYFRTTQAGKWGKGAVRYREWKSYVVASYLDAMEAIPKIERADYGDMHDLLERKPIKASEKKQWMTLKIVFADKSHADCDNIFKGIADALFMNDKYLASRGFDYEYGDAGRVEVTVEL